MYCACVAIVYRMIYNIKWRSLVTDLHVVILKHYNDQREKGSGLVPRLVTLIVQSNWWTQKVVLSHGQIVGFGHNR